MEKALKILVIDDNKMDRRLYRRFLTRDTATNCEIYEAETKDEGVEIYRSQKIDCVLLDYLLPGHNGLKILAQLREINSSIPVVMLTGQGNEILAVEAMKAGLQDYLVKDEIQPEKLQFAITNAVDKASLQFQLKQRTRELEESNSQLLNTLDELKQAQQKIIYQERMTALGEMSSGIAHDFNNALSPIAAFTELLLDIHPHYIKDEKKVKRYLQLMRKCAADAADVVRRMREFYRPKSEEHKSLDFQQLIDEVKTFPQISAGEKKIALVVETQGDLNILGNESELRELLLNLVLNAIEAITDNGQISIQAYAEAGKICVKVSDTGHGMSEDVRNRCFDPFFTTKDSRNSGLGLSMVYGIVQRHNGIIDLDSSPGNGTSFTIAFPKNGKCLASTTKESLTPLETKPLNVLVVDDEMPNRIFLTELLEFEEHIVETAAHGEEALAKFTQKKFDVVITDLSMPHMNGDVLAAKIKSSSPNTPIIMLTAFGDIIKDASKGPGVIDMVLNKPIGINDLSKALAEVRGLFSPG